MKKKRLNKPNVYGRGIAAFYISNRNVATTHLNNQSGSSKLKLKKKENKKENQKKDSINQMCTVRALPLFI